MPFNIPQSQQQQPERQKQDFGGFGRNATRPYGQPQQRQGRQPQYSSYGGTGNGQQQVGPAQRREETPGTPLVNPPYQSPAGRGGPSQMGPVQYPYGMDRGSARGNDQAPRGPQPGQMGPQTNSGYGRGYAPNRGYTAPIQRPSPMGPNDFGYAAIPPDARGGYAPPRGPMGPMQQTNVGVGGGWSNNGSGWQQNAAKSNFSGGTPNDPYNYRAGFGFGPGPTDLSGNGPRRSIEEDIAANPATNPEQFVRPTDDQENTIQGQAVDPYASNRRDRQQQYRAPQQQWGMPPPVPSNRYGVTPGLDDRMVDSYNKRQGY